jgi:pilus assembly protein Flp/PilA
MKKLFLLLRDESGATAIEYALIALLISIAATFSMLTIGTQLQTTFSQVSSDFGSR